MAHYTSIIAAFLLLNGVSSDTNHRLSTTIYPSSYHITITPYFETGDDREFTFDGLVTITLVAGENLNQIKLHSQDLIYNSSDISVTNGNNAVALSAENPLEFNANYSFAYINLQTELQANTEYTLTIAYRGPIRSDLNGFYRNYYIENGVKKWLGATQMEPTHARKVFPSFDEPALKATFTLSIDRPANYRQTLANTELQTSVTLPNGLIRETFHPSPRMSTYLVAFLVSEFEAGHSITTDNEFGVYTRPEAANQTDYAFDFGTRVVNALGDYLRINYYSTNQYLRLDHVALPDFRAGAMENWGLIKYRESLLLYVPEVSTPYFKYRVAQIVAHETTHMWFGNLVTCHWWSNTWLNEGFANYFQDYITSLIEPEVGSEDQLVIGSVYAALDADETPQAPAITNNDVNSPAEISGHFGTITYQKAGSVIRMVHHLIGDEAFRTGLNTYLISNQFDVGYPESMYDSLDRGVNSTAALAPYPGEDITDIMSSWISKPGHPVVHVDVDYTSETVTLTQKRFYVDSAQSSNELYKIPITYTTQSSPDFTDTKPAFIMSDASHTFRVDNLTHGWIIFNIQETGLYRVNYDEHEWSHISEALKGDQRESIHKLNRAKIVNDLFAFVYGDLVDFGVLHDVTGFLKQETEYAVWYAAVRGLDRLRTSYLGTDTLPLIDNYALDILENIINTLGYEERAGDDFATLRNRMQILELACTLGHQGCIDNAVAKFRKLVDEGIEISPSLRPVSYCTGLRFGSGEDYEYLWARMNTTNVANEARIIGDALGCTTDQDKLHKYLVSMLEENSPVKTQDLTVPLTSVLANYSNVELVLQDLEANYTLWTTIYPSMDSVLSTIASALHTEAEFKKFESWLESCEECTAEVKMAATTSLETAKVSASWARSHNADILKVLKNSSTRLTTHWFLLLLCVLTIIFKQ